MAARNPTSYTQWIDQQALESGKPVLASTFDNILNDQVFCLDQEMQIASIAGFAVTGTTSVPAMKTYSTFYVRNKDMCDVDGVTNDEISCYVALRVWTSDAATTGTVQLKSTAVASNIGAVSVLAADLSPVWKNTTMNIKTNDNEDTIELQMSVTGAGYLVCCGIGIFALET